MTRVDYFIVAVLFGSPQWALSCEFSTDIWPGEGRPVFEAVSVSLSIFDHPDSVAKSRVISVIKGATIEFTGSHYCTQSTGSLKILSALSVTGRKIEQELHLTKGEYYLPSESVELKFDSDDLVTFVQYRAEGHCFVRWGDELFETELCLYIGQNTVDVVKEPVTEWWIRSTIDGETGWVLVDRINLQMIDRKF